ncbi:hypothetical protein M406DRAFT_330286 [Cryphonectria parasitica EP155]|uniref:Thioesterase domain-containing protein n=1 Tax=Cryphonectria parasitica (strain ATCC 38755 / EP155) TaxID=660469 RepID=A0A9P5CQH9_CRYP1|nr:uncharacterized protein M406DRAFT_330286 [Cryphonectria parasitica EP155]KAF3766472.1 hypothetical protein M406DRAFT_330286 [Cryphonectria parasitica EP155]
MPRPGDAPTLSREENRRKAMAGVQAIFDRYHLVQAIKGPAFDNATMRNATILDASIGPPYDVPPPPLPSPGVSGTDGALLPPLPNTGIVSSCTSRIFIGPEFSNYNGVMHGGAAGVIFDMLTTIALGPVARPGFWAFLGGVTRTLNLSYLKAIPINTSVVVHAYAYQVGRQTAYIKGWMTSEDGKTTYAVCDHHKIHVPPIKDHMKLKVPWDDLWDEDGKEKKTLKAKI